jgi:hypothetical protein
LHPAGNRNGPAGKLPGKQRPRTNGDHGSCRHLQPPSSQNRPFQLNNKLRLWLKAEPRYTRRGARQFSTAASASASASPAHRHCQRARTASDPDHLRRAGLRPRRLGAGAGDQPVGRSAAGFRALLPLRRPFSLLSGGLPGRRSPTRQTAGLHRATVKVCKQDCKGTIAGTRGNGEVAPIPDLPALVPERGGSVQLVPQKRFSSAKEAIGMPRIWVNLSMRTRR